MPLFDLAKKVKASEKDLRRGAKPNVEDPSGGVVSNRTPYFADEKMLAELRFATMELQSQG